MDDKSQQAPNVTYCRDCSYYRLQVCCNQRCFNHGMATPSDFMCCYGKRRVGERKLQRLTVADVRIDEHRTRRTIIDADAVRENAMHFYWRLKDYEDTGLTPEEIERLKSENAENAELKRYRQIAELKRYRQIAEAQDKRIDELEADNAALREQLADTERRLHQRDAINAEQAKCIDQLIAERDRAIERTKQLCYLECYGYCETDSQPCDGCKNKWRGRKEEQT